MTDSGKLARIEKGACWAGIMIGDVFLGCEYCGEIESAKADRAFAEKISKINTAAEAWAEKRVREAVKELLEKKPIGGNNG